MSDAEILRIADKEYANKLMPVLEGVYKNHHYREDDVTVDSAQDFYRVPSRATANGVRMVYLLDKGGNPCVFEEMSVDSAIRRGARNYAYQWMGGGIRFVGTPPTGYTLRWGYILRPGALDKVGENSADITAKSGVTLTLSSVPATMSVGDKVDVISQHDPYLYSDTDLSIQGIAGSDVTLSADPTNATVGDYLTLTQKTPFFQGPLEAGSVLLKATCASVLNTLGFERAYARMLADYATDLEAFRMRIAKRNAGARPGNYNVHSSIRSRRGRGAYR